MSYDLTNQFISNTFGNLLQKTGSEGHLYDLKGNQIGDIKISGSLTATEYIVSSSIVNQTIAYTSGSTKFGDTSDDTHEFTGSLKLTGGPHEISGSGNILLSGY